MNLIIAVLLTGIGATVVMDIWCLLRQYLLGQAFPNYGMVGRWIGHIPRGRFIHQTIGKSAEIPAEHLIGWAAHYLIGISFAALLIFIAGSEWLHHPTLITALLVGIGTVLAPFLIMQPGMGAGIAASKTPNPAAARLQSIITHGVFGLGLYFSGWGCKWLLQL
ncbi:DUF2938 domain-containing protein [Spongorhabdus nitratireducens]